MGKTKSYEQTEKSNKVIKRKELKTFKRIFNRNANDVLLLLFLLLFLERKI